MLLYISAGPWSVGMATSTNLLAGRQWRVVPIDLLHCSCVHGLPVRERHMETPYNAIEHPNAHTHMHSPHEGKGISTKCTKRDHICN